MIVRSRVGKGARRVTGSNILDGAALVVVSPIVIPALLLRRRPVAKTVIKGSLFLTDKVKLFATTTSEGWKHWVDEARSEVRSATASSTVETVQEAIDNQAHQSTEDTGEATDNQPQQTDEMDLQHLTGVGRKSAELLREAGVESVRALARHDPENLHERLIQINEQQQIVRQVPSLELVTDWVTQARGQES